MKKEFGSKPPTFKKQFDWYDEIASFSWQDFLTAIPSPLFVVTSYKKNGKENACLQSWSTFVGDRGEFICIIGSVNKKGHMYETIQDRKVCVLNFPSRDISDRCFDTIRNNDYDNDEITISGLTAEKAVTVDAPRIQECFLNIECEYLWEHEHYDGSPEVTMALRATHICALAITAWPRRIRRCWGRSPPLGSCPWTISRCRLTILVGRPATALPSPMYFSGNRTNAPCR